MIEYLLILVLTGPDSHAVTLARFATFDECEQLGRALVDETGRRTGDEARHECRLVDALGTVTPPPAAVPAR